MYQKQLQAFQSCKQALRHYDRAGGAQFYVYHLEFQSCKQALRHYDLALAVLVEGTTAVSILQAGASPLRHWLDYRDMGISPNVSILQAGASPLRRIPP